MSKVIDTTLLQDSAITTGNGTSISMINADNLKVDIKRTSVTSNTIIFEVKNSNDDWIAYPGKLITNTSYTVATQTTATGNEIWLFENLAGYTFRARISAIAGTGATIIAKGTKISVA